MSEPQAPGQTAGPRGDDAAAANTFGTTAWGTVARLAPVLAGSLLCLVPVLLAILLLAAPRSLVAAVGDRSLQLAPAAMWTPRMWWSMALALAVVAGFLTWAHAYAMLVAGAVALGRDLGLRRAAGLAWRAIPRLIWWPGLTVALGAAMTVLPWLLVGVVAAGLVWYLHPAAPMALFTRSRQWDLDAAVALARGQGLAAVSAAAVIGYAYWLLNDVTPLQPFGVAGGALLWAAGCSLLITVTGVALAWSLLRHLRSPLPPPAACEAARWLTDFTAPPSRPGQRVGVVGLAAVTVTAALAAALSLAPVSSWASDPAGRAPSWTTQLPDWDVYAGEDGLGALVSGNSVVVAVNQAASPGVVVFDRDGTRRWSYAYRGEQAHHLRFWVTDDAVVLYGLNHDELRILDLRTGRVRFTITAQSDPVLPLISRRTIIAPSGLSESGCWHPRGYDLRTGKARWERTDRCLMGSGDVIAGTSRGAVWTADRLRDPGQPAAATRTSLVWVLTRPGDDDAARRAAALDIDTGEDLATLYRVPAATQHLQQVSGTVFLQYAKPTSTGECPTSGGRVVQAREVKTGKLRWTATIGPWSLEDFSEAACESENLQPTSEGLMTATVDRGLQLLDLATGRPRWTIKAWAPPVALSGRALIMGPDPGDQSISAAPAQLSSPYAALDTRTGRPLWTGQCVGGDVVVTPQRFVCANDQTVGHAHAALRVWVVPGTALNGVLGS